MICLPAHTTDILQPLDIAVFNPLKTGFSTMASRMGLVRGDLVVGKEFSSLLKTVYPTAVTAQNIKAGFWKAGIFPLSRGAVDTTQVVRVLPSADARPSTAPVTPSAMTSSAPVQWHNFVLKTGVIPESLANVLMSPALDRREKVRRRLPLPARVITSDGYVRLLKQKEAEEKEKEEKKRKRKEDMARKIWQRRRRKKHKRKRPKGRRYRHHLQLRKMGTLRCLQ
ncbi:unnamed protein product [Leuciscus chuanchicus]